MVHGICVYIKAAIRAQTVDPTDINNQDVTQIKSSHVRHWSLKLICYDWSVGAEEHVCDGLGKARVLKGRLPNDIRAREASKEVVHLVRVFIWFLLGDQVKKKNTL